MTIYKYVLEVTDEQTVFMPKSACILCCQTQREKPCLWALVDPSAELEQRTFFTYGTGHRFYGGQYIGTYQLSDGLVFHVFEASNVQVDFNPEIS